MINIKGRVQNKKNTVLGNMSVEGGGGSEPIPTALSEKVRDFLHKGGGVIPKIPIPKWLFFSFLGYKMIIGH